MIANGQSGVAIDTDAAFMDKLRRLSSQQKAALRRHAGKTPWSPDVMSVVAPYLPNVEGAKRDAEIVRLSAVATLYACHDTIGRATIGSGMASLAEKNENMAERLMRQAIACDTVGDLWHGPLLRIVKALAAASISLDWLAVLKDLGEWHDPRKRAQQRWSRAFWGGARRFSKNDD